MRIFAFIASLIFALPASATDVLPSQYVGIWATEESVFHGSNLVGGTAIYLDTNGQGAIVGAPLPVGMCGDRICTPIIGMPVRVSVEKDGNAIRAALTDGKETIEAVFAYDNESKSLITASGKDRGQRFIRREAELPSEIKSALRGKPAVTEREKH